MSFKRGLIQTMSNLGLIGAAHEVRGLTSLAKPRTLLSTLRSRIAEAPDGLPIPPPRLTYLVAGTYDVECFLTFGRRGADAILRMLARNGIDINRFGAMLDWGCGSGRVLRYFNDLPSVDVHGCDYNPRLTAWCASELTFAKISTNRLEPPLPYDDATFDFVYALSVFTHFGQDLQFAWIDEMRRVIRPGGDLYFTTHGDSYLPRLEGVERDSYLADELVIRRQHLAGKNICNAYYSRNYVEKNLTRGCTIVDFEPEGAEGNPTQDAYLVRFGT